MGPLKHAAYATRPQVADRLQEMLSSVKDELDAALLSSVKYAEEHGSRILFTGHSSGGSLAHLAAFYAHQSGQLRDVAARTHVISFGAARVGNTPFSRAYAAALPNTYRIVRRADPFAHRLSCKSSLFQRQCKESDSHGYHVPTEVYYEGDMPSAVQNDAIFTAASACLMGHSVPAFPRLTPPPPLQTRTCSNSAMAGRRRVRTRAARRQTTSSGMMSCT